MIEAKISGDSTPIVRGICLRACIAPQRDHAAGVDGLSDQAACGTNSFVLSLDAGAKENSQGGNRTESEENTSRQASPPTRETPLGKKRNNRAQAGTFARASISCGDRNHIRMRI